ncbi:MAG: efflux RND transporter periplasmic adaptor subunit [Candidatus Wallbacteria bacterium]|nr:efflux RND transporter periplasmic adaptor subunit [Candidatus Wallbacteria bacterium]
MQSNKSLLLFFVFLLLVFGCGRSVFKSAEIKQEKSLIFAGELKPLVSHSLCSPSESILVDIRDEGSFIKTGEIIARFSTEEIKNELDGVTTEIETLNLNRQIELLDKEIERIQLLNEIKFASYEVAVVEEELKNLKPEEKTLIPMRREIAQSEKKFADLSIQLKDTLGFAEKGYISSEEVSQKSKEVQVAKIELEKLRQDFALKNDQPELTNKSKAAELSAQKQQLEQCKVELQSFDKNQEIDRINYEITLSLKQKSLLRLEKLLQESSITSPSSGFLVLEKTWIGGESRKVMKGTTLWEGLIYAKVQGASKYRVEFQIPQFYSREFKVGSQVEFHLLPYPDKLLTAEISYLSPVASYDRNDRKGVRKIKGHAVFEASGIDLLPGMTVYGNISGSAIARSDRSGTITKFKKITVAKKKFVKKLEGMAEFYSLKSVFLSNVSRGKADTLAQDGSEVKTDEVMAVFSNEDLDKRLKDREDALSQKSSEVELLADEEDKLRQSVDISLDNLKKKLEIAETEYELACSANPTSLKKLALKKEKLSALNQLLMEKEKSNRELFDKGFISRNELQDSEDALQQNETELILLKIEEDKELEGSPKLERLQKELAYQKASCEYEKALKNQKNSLESFALKKKRTMLEFENAKFNYDSQVRTIDKMTFKAPISGYALRLKRWTNNGSAKIKEGDELWPYESFMAITDVNNLALKGYLEERYLNLVKIGQPVLFYFSKNPDEKFSGKVLKIDPYIQKGSPLGNSNTNSFQIQISVDQTSPKFQPEAQVDFQIIAVEIPDAVAIPSEAVFKDEKGYYVLTSRKNKKRVEIADRNEEEFLIGKGIGAGEAIQLPESETE